MSRRIAGSVVTLALALGLTACVGGMAGGGMMVGGMMHGGSSTGPGANAGSNHLVQETIVGTIQIAVSYPATGAGPPLT